MGRLKAIKRRWTGKTCYNKLDKVNGVVLHTSSFLVEIGYEDGTKKIYTKERFLREFEIAEQKQETKPKEKHIKTGLKNYANITIGLFFKKHYVNDVITFVYQHKGRNKVLYNGLECGYITITDKKVEISYFIRLPNLLLKQYRVNVSGYPKLNLTYRFTELNATNLNDFYICLNELIYAHKENMQEFIENR